MIFVFIVLVLTALFFSIGTWAAINVHEDGDIQLFWFLAAVSHWISVAIVIPRIWG